jgi:hypothetical protein
MKRVKVTALLLAIGCIGQAAPAAEAAKIKFGTYSGYFVSNQFEPNAPESFVVISDQEQFDRIFGVAMVMGDKSHRLAKDAFKSNIFLTAIKRGAAFWGFQVQDVSEKDGVVEFRYTTTMSKSDTATFACPVIVSIPKGKYTAVHFVENGKAVKTIEVRKK